MTTDILGEQITNRVKALKEEHEALSDILKDARKIGVSGACTTKWFCDIKIIIDERLDEIEKRLIMTQTKTLNSDRRARDDKI